MATRREFLGGIGLPVVAACAAPRLRADARRRAPAAGQAGDPEKVARDEAFWGPIQRAFTADRSLINLNNGGVSPAPSQVQQALARHLEFSNTAPTHAMWGVLEPRKEGVRQQLARSFGCDPEEIAITRNASEGLQICQFGFDLEAGDEVLTTTQDYPRMITTWKQRERREKIVLKQIQIPTPAEEPDEVVRRFEDAISERTKLILVCHMINLTGQILPVREVAALGRRRGIPVIVDGAHSFNHFAFSHGDLDCDYFATSLHKWTFAPFGTGMLYVRRSKIARLWPLMAAPLQKDDDIRKFEEIGTHPCPNFIAIGDALAFNEAIGAHNKQARLIYLRDRWAHRLRTHDRVRLYTSLEPGFACGIATMGVEGIDTKNLADRLLAEHGIIVTPIVHDEVDGIRVSPSVYTRPSEIDRFADAVERMLKAS